MRALVFDGDKRVWRASALAIVPLALLIVFYCLRPQDYYTGTNSVEALTYVAEARAGVPVCVPDVQIPANTAGIRLLLVSRTTTRPALELKLNAAGGSVPLESRTPATSVPGDRISAAVFPIPPTHAEAFRSLCVTSRTDTVNWGGTPLSAVPRNPATEAGSPIPARISLWYLPRTGSQRSYLSGAGSILERAALFRPSPVGPWLYLVILLVLLPGLAIASVRCLALACARPAGRLAGRRMAAAMFVIAALNFACWAMITPPFQAPDEVDHFAYTQSLVERGEAPSRSPASPLARWSSSESRVLEDMSFPTDHQVGDTRVPWTTQEYEAYSHDVRSAPPSSADGGGNETAATHGSIYYAALAPAYMLASRSPLDQLTLMRLMSALIGALTVLFAYLLARELAPGRPWLAVLAALLVAYQPMYGFISGAVNNDVGVNAGAAGLELLLILILRRGITLSLGILAGAVLIALPIVKGTAYSLYPVAGVVLLLTLWRHHRRSDLAGWAGVIVAAVAVHELAGRLSHVFRPAASAAPGSGGGASGGAGASNALHEVLAHPFGYLAYLWEVFLPRLSFMAPHFETASPPGFVIFVERGWGAFGWYDVFFPKWIYYLIFGSMLAAGLLGLVAGGREWAFVRRNLPEAGILLLVPIAVVAGFEAAFYTTGSRPAIAEFGRYAFPAIAPLAVLVVGSLHAFGRRWAPLAGAVLLVGMVTLSYAAQLVTLTGFYA